MATLAGAIESPSETRPVSALRASLVVGFSAALWALVLIFVRESSHYAVKVFAGMFITTWLASLLEWAVHRYVYHRRLVALLQPIYRVHHAGHHHIFFPPRRYVANGGVRRFSLDAQGVPHVHEAAAYNSLTSLLHFCFYMLTGGVMFMLPSWLAAQDPVFLISMLLDSALISYLFIAVHDAIHHRDLHPIMAKCGWFKWLDDHHYIHHVDTEANVNFLLPLGDLLFGTLRRSLTPREVEQFGSAEAGRSRAIGFDEPAQDALRRETEHANGQ